MRAAPWLAGALVALTCAAAQAQQARPSRAQLALMDQGAQAYQRGDHDAAERLYREALAQGELNIAWLNLGRLLQKQSRCAEARDALARALSSPAVQRPSPDEVRASVDRYLAEMPRLCQGALLVQCAEPSPRLLLEGAPLRCGELAWRAPGAYVLEIWEGDVRTLRQVELVGEQTQTLTLTSPRRAAPPSPAPVARDEGRGQRLLGWSLLGAGGAAMLTGGVFSALVLQNDQEVAALGRAPIIDPARAEALFDQGEDYNIAQFLGYGLGLGLGVAGALFLWLGQDDEPHGPALGLAPLPQAGWMLSISWR